MAATIDNEYSETCDTSSITFLVNDPAGTFEYTEVCDVYEIESRKKSETSLVLFTHHEITKKPLVIKVLNKYKDTSYSLETTEERQQCQLEALRSNRLFTPEVYLGLASVLKADLNRIVVGEVIVKPTRIMLDPNADYALLMRTLPENRRLDKLLEDKRMSHERGLLLTKRVTEIHRNLEPVVTSYGGDIQWGSCEQLQKKLVHNLEFSDAVMAASENEQYSCRAWLERTLDALKEPLPLVVRAVYRIIER